MGETEEFNTLAFEKRLMQLKDTQESIQGMSAWCLKQRSHHKKIVSSWLNVLKRVKIEQRLVLFYLANDVIQYSKRKNYEFVESWGLNLQKATPLVRDEKVRPKILRIFKIWEQRSVYDDEFLSDLTGLLSAGAIKKTDDDPMDFQPQQLVNKIKQCTVLEADTDLRLKYIHESPLQLSDEDELCNSLKEKSNKEDVDKELNEGIACVERYTQALQREIVAREALLALLTSANQYYSTQRGEVKVVAYAYKNFGARVRALKRKLDELIPQLKTSDPSPPHRDEDVPSPGPDEDLDLPTSLNSDAYDIDKTFNTSFADGSLYNMGLSSFLNSENPLAMFSEPENITINNTSNKIEVLNTRPSDKQDFDLNDFLKNIAPTEKNTSDNISVASGTLSQQSQDALPGLDLLTPESTGNPPPPTSFYGSLDNSVNDEPEPYRPETTNMWTNNNWNIPPAPVPPPPAVFIETPESPPHPPPPRTEPRTYNPLVRTSPPPSDVDHRGLLPPPPPPPVLPMLGHIEDVDHRSLPNLLSVPPPRLIQPPPQPVSDVDHRNLISLTNRLPPVPPPRPLNNMSSDQDYRVPPVVAPNDIVESVDMDLSEDEDQQGMYPNQSRHYNNNKVLVGGDTDSGKTADNHNFSRHPNNVHQQQEDIPNSALPMPPMLNLFNDFEKNEPPHTAPILPPMSNPFDNMPPDLKNFNFREDPRMERESDPREDDLRSRSLHLEEDFRNQSPPEYVGFNNGEWSAPRGGANQRFPRNWSPRTSRPQGYGPQFWPRNGPRPPNNRWMGPRPQRFW